MSPHFFAYMIHILESLEKIESFTKSDPLLQEARTYDAVLYRIQTLAESACKLPDDVKQKHSAIRWKDFARMRNAIVHDYLGDMAQSEILQFIENYLPPLQEVVLTYLPEWKKLRDSFEEP